MASTGNVFAGTGENNAGIGLTAWTAPGNILSDDATDATCNATASSQYLVARNFSLLSVPVNATVDGITVRAECSEHSAGTESLNAQLQDASGALMGASKANTVSGTAKAVYTYGGAADKWSAAPTPAMIHDPDFGVRFWFVTAHDVRADFVTLAVEYTVPPPGIATETDSALALGRTKILNIGMATETDAALALHRVVVLPIGLSSEADSALALGLVKARPIGLSSEVDAALALGRTKILVPGLAMESDAGFPLMLTRIYPIGRADETDIALPLSIGGGGVTILPVGIATEIDLAFAPSSLKVIRRHASAFTGRR